MPRQKVFKRTRKGVYFKKNDCAEEDKSVEPQYVHQIPVTNGVQEIYICNLATKLVSVIINEATSQLLEMVYDHNGCTENNGFFTDGHGVTNNNGGIVGNCGDNDTDHLSVVLNCVNVVLDCAGVDGNYDDNSDNSAFRMRQCGCQSWWCIGQLWWRCAQLWGGGVTNCGGVVYNFVYVIYSSDDVSHYSKGDVCNYGGDVYDYDGVVVQHSRVSMQQRWTLFSSFVRDSV